MFNTVQNTVSIDFQLVPDGPLLVRAKSVGLDPGIADTEFHRTTRNGVRTVFLAGSGLKGVIRSHFERLLRTAGSFICDPTRAGEKQSCGYSRRYLGQGVDKRRPHAGQCGACFTFGSLNLAGRFRIGDAYPVKGLEEATNLTEVRTGVGLDRKSQGAARGVLYDSEVVVQGAFRVRMTGESFSLWQVGLLLQALEDVDSGFVQVGGCKSRGMGTMRVENPQVVFRFLDDHKGQLVGAEHKGSDFSYGLPEGDRLTFEPGEGVQESYGLFRTVRFQAEAVAGLREQLVNEAFVAYAGKAA